MIWRSSLKVDWTTPINASKIERIDPKMEEMREPRDSMIDAIFIGIKLPPGWVAEVELKIGSSLH